MDQLGVSDFSITDCHIHYAHPNLMKGLISACDKLGLDKINIVCTPDMKRLSLIPDALHLKSHYPERVYVFGGLDVSVYFREPRRAGKLFADSIEYLMGLGCDGIKMIEAKPQIRKMLPIPAFNSDIFAPYWEKLSQTQFPLLMHVNDPEEFWDVKKAPKWAFDRGWFYGDGSYINNEEQYLEILDVLKKNPTLRVIFAHFFFMSSHLERLAEILEEYPNVSVDLTPGIEMFFNFSKNPEKARDFFIRYQDRILFGTDIGAKALLGDPEEGIKYEESRGRVSVVRNFLELDIEYHLPAGSGFLFGEDKTLLHGIGLPKGVLEKIYKSNFERIAGNQPRGLNPGLITAFCEQLENTISAQGSSQPGIPGDKSVAEMVRAHFKSV